MFVFTNSSLAPSPGSVMKRMVTWWLLSKWAGSFNSLQWKPRSSSQTTFLEQRLCTSAALVHYNYSDYDKYITGPQRTSTGIVLGPHGPSDSTILCLLCTSLLAFLSCQSITELILPDHEPLKQPIKMLMKSRVLLDKEIRWYFWVLNFHMKGAYPEFKRQRQEKCCVGPQSGHWDSD